MVGTWSTIQKRAKRMPDIIVETTETFRKPKRGRNYYFLVRVNFEFSQDSKTE